MALRWLWCRRTKKGAGRLFGQNQLVILRDPKAVFVAAMFNDDLTAVAEQFAGQVPEGVLHCVRAALQVGSVLKAQSKRLKQGHEDGVISLLTMAFEPGEAPEIVVAAPPLAERLSMMFEAPVRTPKEADVALDELFDTGARDMRRHLLC